MTTNEDIEKVADPYVRGRLQVLQDLIIGLDNQARDMRAQISDLEVVTGSHPHVDQVMNKLRAALMYERLLEVNAQAGRLVAQFTQEAKAYEAKLKENDDGNG